MKKYSLLANGNLKKVYFLLDAPTGTRFTINPPTTTVVNGNIVSFNCTTDAYPPAHMYNFFNNGNLFASNGVGVYSTELTESGDYTCSSINAAGSGQSAPLLITVTGKGKII